jgi:beta-galactosidase/beta-glucuronidase
LIERFQVCQSQTLISVAAWSINSPVFGALGLLLNGKPIIIAGVNRHEHSAVHGHYCSVEEMREDIIQMKKLNFNAVRTCHYANAPELYALANEYGLYVNDEANIAKKLRFISS